MSRKPFMEVRCDGLKVGERELLRPFHFGIAKGGMRALIGKNGTGKSTLLRYMVGLLQSRHFMMEVEGRSFAKVDLKERSRLIGWLPQRMLFQPDFTVMDFVLLGRFCFHRGFPAAIDLGKCREMLDRLGICGREQNRLSELSGGELQRVGLARVLVGDTALYCLDEPFSNLDIDHAAMVYDVFNEMCSLGKTFIFSFHGLDLLNLHGGSLLAINSENQLKSYSSAAELKNSDLREIYQTEITVHKSETGVPVFFLSR